MGNTPSKTDLSKNESPVKQADLKQLKEKRDLKGRTGNDGSNKNKPPVRRTVTVPKPRVKKVSQNGQNSPRSNW